MRRMRSVKIQGVQGVKQPPVRGSKDVPLKPKHKSNPRLFFFPVRALGLCTSTPIMYLFTFCSEIF